MTGYRVTDAEGFIRLLGLPLAAVARRREAAEELTYDAPL
jgi:hypothetical protein